MHRDFAGRVLSVVLVVPLTTRIRNIPTEVKLGVDDGRTGTVWLRWTT